LAGGAINKAVQGPQTVVISANQQDRKPKVVQQPQGGRPSVAGYGVTSPPAYASAGQQRRPPAAAQTRFAVIPRPASRYASHQQVVYRAGQPVGRPIVVHQSYASGQSRPQGHQGADGGGNYIQPRVVHHHASHQQQPSLHHNYSMQQEQGHSHGGGGMYQPQQQHRHAVRGNNAVDDEVAADHHYNEYEEIIDDHQHY
jgi:hypothetical protein